MGRTSVRQFMMGKGVRGGGEREERGGVMESTEDGEIEMTEGERRKRRERVERNPKTCTVHT